MKKTILALCSIFLISCSDSNVTVSGAGATFPAPLYTAWSIDFAKQSQAIQINYQPIGSGGGIQQIKEGTVTFGATDMPLNINELLENNLFQFPVVIGGLIPIINIPGINSCDIVLDGPTLSKIYRGEIDNWNDPRIKELNPNLYIPNLPIIAVHRSDGSGSTYILSDYLSKVDAFWEKELGAATSLNWKTGIGSKGNEGVAGTVALTPGSIGYVEYVFAKINNDIQFACMINKNGNKTSPSVDSFRAAAENALWNSDDGYNVSLTNQPGENAWPMTSSTFILMHLNLNTPKEHAVQEFFKWAFKNGDQQAAKLYYVSLPEKLEDEIIAGFYE